MRKIFIIVLSFLTICTNFNPINASDSIEFSISKGTIGKIKLGMPIKEIYSIFTKKQIKETTKTGEGDDYEAYDIFLNNNQKVSIELIPECKQKDDCNISSATVYEPKFKTNLGIGVGNTLGNLKKAYKNLYVVEGEGRIIIYCKNKELKNVGFILDGSWYPKKADFSVKDIPNAVKISEIYLFSTSYE